MLTNGWFFPPPRDKVERPRKSPAPSGKRIGSDLSETEQPPRKKQRSRRGTSPVQTLGRETKVESPPFPTLLSSTTVTVKQEPVTPPPSPKVTIDVKEPAAPSSPVKPPKPPRLPGRPRKTLRAAKPVVVVVKVEEQEEHCGLDRVGCTVCGDAVRERYKCSLCTELVVCRSCVGNRRHRDVNKGLKGNPLLQFLQPVREDHKMHSGAHTLMWFDCVDQLEVAKPSLPMYSSEKLDPCLPMPIDWGLESVF